MATPAGVGTNEQIVKNRLRKFTQDSVGPEREFGECLHSLLQPTEVLRLGRL